MEVTSLSISNLLSSLLSKTRFLEFVCCLCKFYQPYPLSRNGLFSPFFTPKMPPTDMNCFSSYSLPFLLFLLFIICKKCMFDLKIKWKSFKYVEIESKMPLKSHKSLSVLCIIKN